MLTCLLCEGAVPFELSLPYLLTGRLRLSDRLCPDCWAAFERVDSNACPNCGRQMGRATLCSDCRLWQERGQGTLSNQALYQYNDQMKDYMARYKFIGDYRLRQIFQKEMKAAIRKRMKDDQVNAIVPIPLIQERLDQRGFNQVRPFLPNDCPIINALAVRPGKHRDQSSRTRFERLAAKQPFVLKEEARQAIAFKRVLIVDDVYTTGRTLYHAANCLLAAGASAVFSQTLAR
ncbi:ComF family protein [Fructobacillus sp. M158]|uniref:ComF family protein n=1 Tax=Fructobacillus parabroussonetiae TaxID=2713174 RepID=UPI00200B6306|nr:ComF family protein [Fructobacillus parabroussonetiae]MCK8617767.1 ComF family protein [Fructobacillus parabroussonetiae]